MLLVDNDQAEIAEWQEQRRTRADDEVRATLGNGAPGRGAPVRRYFGMPDRRGSAEAHGEAVEPLRRQRDLGQQHQHLAAGAQRRRDGLVIDFRLARTGNAVEQGDGEGVRRDGLAQRHRRSLLLGRQDRTGLVGVGLTEGQRRR